MNALLEHFQGERVMLLLDNFEPVETVKHSESPIRNWMKPCVLS